MVLLSSVLVIYLLYETLGHEQQAMKEKIKENAEKIKVNKTLPYLVSNVIEILDVDPQVG